MAAGVFIGLALIMGANTRLAWLPGFGIFAACTLVSFGLKRHARIK
jgi:hypothetical protein